MPSRQPGRRAIVVASIIGLAITLIWAATFRRLYLNAHPLGTWEQSACHDVVADAPATSGADDVWIAVHATVPYGFRGIASTREVMCAFRSSDGALLRRFVLQRPLPTPPSSPVITARLAHDVLYVEEGPDICAFSATTGSQLWCQTTQASGYPGELLVTDDAVLHKANGALEAFDPLTGAQLWHEDLGDALFLQTTTERHTFAVSTDTIYAGRNDPLSADPGKPDRRLMFCARAARTGEQHWCESLGVGTLGIAGVTVGQGIAFVVVSGPMGAQQTPPRLYGLRATDGTVLWQQQLDCNGAWAPLLAYAPDTSSTASSSLLVATPQCSDTTNTNPPFLGEILALGASDGTVRWRATPGTLLAVAVADSTVYLDTVEMRNGQSVATASDIFALRLSDASQIWHTHLSTPVTTLTLAGDMIYSLTGSAFYGGPLTPASIYALRRADGGELWQSTGCSAGLDPYFWHDHILRHEQSAPVWCHWLSAPPYTATVNPVLH